MTAAGDVWVLGCGDVGTVAGQELAALGHRVFGVRRHADGIAAPLVAVAGDVTDPATYAALPDPHGFVLYTAAASAPVDEAAYRRAYVDGPRVMLDVLAARGVRPRAVVFASSTAVYAQDDGALVDESSPTEPIDFRGRILCEAERQLLAAPLPIRIVRLGGIYGPGRTWLVDAVRSGRLGITADGRSPFTNRIHRDDAARALVHVARHPDVGTIVCAVDREPARRDDVVRWLAARLAVVPVVGSTERTRGGDKRVCSDRLVASGFQFRHPTFRDGYAALFGAS